MNTGLFTPRLAALTPSSLQKRGRSAERVTAPAATNQQLLDAARAHYAAHSAAVDTTARQGSQYVTSPDGQQQTQILNGYDWKSGRADPSIATPVYQSDTMAPAVDTAKADNALASMVIGISQSLTMGLGESGGIGVGFDLGGQGAVNGVGYIEGRFGLDIVIGANLQLGMWTAPVGALAGDFIGLEIDIPAGEIVGLTLGVYTTATLDLVGFTIGLGVGLGGGAVVVDGHTWVF